AALMAGALCERWGIFSAGSVSAADPKYTVGPQRERADRAAPSSVNQ
ncbi:MAG: polysulfide reductase, partial [Candidatus Dormiibacterota bacterium]